MGRPQPGVLYVRYQSTSYINVFMLNNRAVLRKYEPPMAVISYCYKSI